MTVFDYIIGIIYIVLKMADAATTIYGLRHGATEKNSLLGKNPSPFTVLLTSFIAIGIAWGALIYIENSDIAHVVVIFGSFYASYCVWNNIRVINRIKPWNH